MRDVSSTEGAPNQGELGYALQKIFKCGVSKMLFPTIFRGTF